MPSQVSFPLFADTERAIGLLRQYQASLTSPEEQALKTSVGKVSAIFGSQLFKALLGKICFWVNHVSGHVTPYHFCTGPHHIPCKITV